jgi:DNA-binding MarR family transcriptional regulator
MLKAKENQVIGEYNPENELIENLEQVQVLCAVEKRHFRKGSFYMQTFSLDSLILDREYGLPEIKTLIALKKKLGFNNKIKPFTQEQVAKEVKSDQGNVSRAIKRLIADGIIYKGSDKEYIFSDEFIKGAGDRW